RGTPRRYKNGACRSNHWVKRCFGKTPGLAASEPIGRGPRSWVRPRESAECSRRKVGCAATIGAGLDLPSRPPPPPRSQADRQGIGNVWNAAGAAGGGNAAGIDPNLGKS